MSDIVDRIASKFTSGNDVPVDSARITADEWSALLAHIQRGAVPEPEQIALWAAGWRCFDESDGLTGEAAMLDRIAHAVHRAMLAAPAPDQFRDAAKMMAEPAEVPEDLRMRLVEAWDYGQFADDFDQPLAKRIRADIRALCELLASRVKAQANPTAPAEVPMPEHVAYGFGNTAITGHTNRLMMVRIDIPGGDQYAGAFWLPLVLADEARTYGDAREAAGYVRGLADERERCASVAWAHYMDTCRRKGIGPDVLPDWCCAAALRGEVKP